jgi:hypothetical protein
MADAASEPAAAWRVELRHIATAATDKEKSLAAEAARLARAADKLLPIPFDGRQCDNHLCGLPTLASRARAIYAVQ